MTALIKWLLRGLLRALYRVEVSGMEHYHAAGKRVLIIANHTSLLDGVLLYAWLPETPTFAINTGIASRRSFALFLRFVDLFEMDPSSPQSLKSMIRFIRKDNKAVIFPEGRITTTGTLMKIYEGPALIAEKAEATILPVAIDGAHHTRWSYLREREHLRGLPKIRLRVLPPRRISLDPELSHHEQRKQATRQLQQIMQEVQFATFDYRQTLFTALATAAGRYGNRLTVLEDTTGTTMTYRQLLTRVMVLSRVMAPQTQRGEHVGLLLPNTLAVVVSFFALQFLGRVPAMLNYSAGTQNILKACQAAGIRRVYTSRQFIEKAGLETLIAELENAVEVIRLEDLRERIGLTDKLAGLFAARRPLSAWRRQGTSQSTDPAVILFTSGSEGIPKGVVLSHENILANFAQVRTHIDFKPSDVVFTCLPLFHSFGLNAGLLMPLLGGSRVFLYPTPLHYRIIPQLVYDKNATILFGTNTFFKGYAHHAHQYDFNTLRYVVAGAEKLRDDTRQLWMDKFGIRILEGYGVTETSPVISVNTPIISRSGSVGLPLPGMRCHLEPVEGIDQGGRLHVQGPNIMMGYLLHDSDGRIIPPVTVQGSGWHDTGDIADIDEEGFITILGRAKRFAKIGGEMVSLTTVEELAMHTWPDAGHAAVVLPDERKGEKIILVTDHADAHRKDLQETAKQLKYSELCLPKKIVYADEIPVLGTGKTDYLLLTRMVQEEDSHGSGWIRRIGDFVRHSGNPEQPAQAVTEAGDSPTNPRETGTGR